MKIIEPSVEYWKQGDNVKAHVAKCARVCYGKESGNDDVTINTLLKKHHWSMFRHESVYAIIPVHERELKDYPLLVLSNPYIKTHTYNGNVYVATNKQFVDTEHLYVFDYNRGKIFHIDVPINTQNEDIPNILEEYGLKESECNYMITEYPCKIINLTYEDKIVNKKDKI